ncbi:P-loop nucleoside triphosphate hydrolases superfamily protein with CH (Calponin Homology) domain [Raphanus sativus]|nr:P-loop nucleoside triphosphate hydrolases superfamily protein with CH (Calponin Homology) domain [Raphanus sativus]
MTGLHEIHLASRRAEEAAARRFQAVQWLQSVVSQLGIPSQPSEKEFVACLRNGMILCNAINKIHPGAVTKVVAQSHLQSCNREYQLPQAYQYFENVRNFLVALEQLRLPGFEASDLEKDNIESGSVSKVVDCILGLKAYHDGFYKHIKTPPFQLSATKVNHSLGAYKTSRQLDRTDCTDGESDQIKVITKLFADHIVNSKENFYENLISQEDGSKSCKNLLHRTKCNHKRLLKTQENELAVLKSLFIETKQDFQEYQLHLQRDLMELGNQMQEMSSAAQGYYKVVEENRKLFNMVQDLKGNIRVFCRVRPISNSETNGVIDYIGRDGSLFVVDPSKPLKDARKTFQFNQVFGPTSTQDDVFRETKPLIRSVMDGYNVCIFAYGQTGSGKTYTMSGPPSRSITELGINYLALSDLFLICDKRRDMINYEIYVQMVEIYNEQCSLLLIHTLDIRTCSSEEEDGLSLPNATMHYVNSTMDVLKLMEAGEVNRAVGSTSMNNRSSRSHSIFMVHVRGKDTSGGTIRSCLHLVDLAGSERVDKSEVTGDRLKEAQYINRSLSCLGDVISALAQKSSHIPYRNSKLTLLLQDALGGQAKTMMIAHLSPEEDSFGETISTLKFAQRVSSVELGAASAHKETREIMQLKEQLETLKKKALGGAEECNKEMKSPLSRPIATTERTPPRFRRLSIENCSNTTLKDRRGIKSPLVSPRGAKEIKSPLRRRQIQTAERTPPRLRRLSIENFSSTRSPLDSRDAQILSLDGLRSYEKDETSKGDLKNPLSPSMPHFQLMQTPVNAEVDTRTSGKGSHIRKSLRTIGKLINGSEKRKENLPENPLSPLGVSNNFSGVKSPFTSNVKTLRRQSLTGQERSSIRVDLVENGIKGARNAKTPPPERSSSKIEKKRD